jgi:hypothetical protein
LQNKKAQVLLVAFFKHKYIMKKEMKKGNSFSESEVGEQFGI